MFIEAWVSGKIRPNYRNARKNQYHEDEVCGPTI